MNYTIQCGSCRNTLPETDFRGQFQGQYYKSCIRCREYSKEYYQHKKSTKIISDAAELCANDQNLLFLFYNLLSKGQEQTRNGLQ